MVTSGIRTHVLWINSPRSNVYPIQYAYSMSLKEAITQDFSIFVEECLRLIDAKANRDLMI